MRTALLAVALSLAAIPASAADWQPTTFVSAGKDEVAAEQTTVTVPEHHRGAPGATISLPVIRFKSTSARPGPPIVYLAGGPGGSGFESVRGGPFGGFMQLRAYADVVTFDQRGTGRAQPSLALQGRYDLPTDRPMRDPASLARFRQIAVEGAAEMKRRGVDLAAYNTAESAEDIEAVRQALGADKIVVWGHSYGSHLGLAYVKAHPEHVAAAVFSGVNDLGNRWRLPSDSDAWLARIDAAVRADKRMSERMPAPFLTLVERVLKKLEAQPQRVAVSGRTVYVGREEMQALMALQAGDINFVRQLPMMFASMDRGDFAIPARMLDQLRLQPLGTAMTPAMHLASGVSPAKLARIAAEAPRSLSGQGINFPYVVDDYREPWGIPDLGEDFRRGVPSDLRALFLEGQFDGRTSVREARETASRFRNARFAEVDGVGHDIYAFSPALGEAIIAFLETGKAPPPHIPALAVELRSPDEDAIIKELGFAVAVRGADAAIARMEALARATSGPYFNVTTARQAGFAVLNGLKKPDAAIKVFEAADRLYPNDYTITRQLVLLYRDAGDKAKARSYVEALRRINPLAPGLDNAMKELAER